MLCKERWSVPDSQRHELRLAPGSHFAGWWIKLVLVDSDGTLEWILYHDQLPPARWKALAREVRSTS